MAIYSYRWFEGDTLQAERDLQTAIKEGSMNSTAAHELHEIIGRSALPLLADPVVQQMTVDERLDELALIYKDISNI
jgi:hypothetical protein